MQQAYQAPEGGILAVFLGIPAHDTLERQGVLDVEGFFVVLLQQGKGLLSGDGEIHIRSS